ncbi:MAG: DNA translocase FtsK 4TM domain-containing protein [Candidatus Nomurabacteria bacterium]|nr:MAG: DNA translocase FtsK 4TM domain-containing protein [Candidatus Nomurabacteria bacterium]
MATKNVRRRGRPTPWDTDEEQAPEESQLSPETKRGIIVVVIFVAALVFILGFFDLAGVVGEWLDKGLGWLFGWSRYLLPLFLVAIGFALLKPDTIRLRAWAYVGAGLFMIAFAGLLHLLVDEAEIQNAITDGRGGGGIGYVMRQGLESMFGQIAAITILLALLIIGVLVMFNTTLHAIAGQRTVVDRSMNRLRFWFYRLKIAFESHKDEEPEEEEEDVEEDEREFTARDIAGAEDGEEEGEGEEDIPAHGEGTQAQIFPKVRRKKRKADVPINLLEQKHEKPMSGNIEEGKQKIKRTLETFGIDVEMDEVNVGPTVTQYTLKPAEGVKLAQITTLQNDLALALAAHPIRIEAPIPGKSLVGIEVPNKASAVVTIHEMLSSDNYSKRKSNLSLALGKDVAGNAWVSDLDPMPHLLIAGSTGSGKSVCINTILMSLLYSNTPDDLRLIMVDPKRVELSNYNGIPHLLTPVITDVDKTVHALKWVVGEMDRRYETLSQTGKRNIKMYREEIDDGMPYIVVVIDELADLMAVASRDVEAAIVRLAQMARAVGIHLIVATQRPSVDVITGLIKANITARIAFNVASIIDSRTILDLSGAEKLLGKGDMLFLSSDLSKPKRLQGAFVSEKEIERVVDYLKDQAEPQYVEEVTARPKSAIGAGGSDMSGEDDLLEEAKEVILRAGKASASLLQRRLRVGYARAARLLDLLEEEGFIGPGEGAKPREVLGGVPVSNDGFDVAEELDDEEIVEDDGEEAEVADDDEEEDEEESRA